MIWTHVSELAIDRLLAGEVAGVDAAAMRDHATGCRRCGALLDDALATQRAFAVEPPLGLPIPLIRRRSRAPLVGAAVAALAAAAMLVAWPRTHDDAVRTKGTAMVGFFVAHGDDVRRGNPRETVTPGDRIELVTTTNAPAWFAVVGVDAAGHRSVYITPRTIDAGRELVVPLSIELDDTLGDERVTALFCAAAFDPLAPPDGCTTDHFTLVKVPR